MNAARGPSGERDLHICTIRGDGRGKVPAAPKQPWSVINRLCVHKIAVSSVDVQLRKVKTTRVQSQLTFSAGLAEELFLIARMMRSTIFASLHRKEKVLNTR